jgi:hypothetical protein
VARDYSPPWRRRGIDRQETHRHKVTFEHLPDLRVSHSHIRVVPQHLIEFFVDARERARLG